MTVLGTVVVASFVGLAFFGTFKPVITVANGVVGSSGSTDAETTELWMDDDDVPYQRPDIRVPNDPNDWNKQIPIPNQRPEDGRTVQVPHIALPSSPAPAVENVNSGAIPNQRPEDDRIVQVPHIALPSPAPAEENVNSGACPGGWKRLDGQYLAGHVFGSFRKKKFINADEGLAAAKTACESTSGCSGITCKGTTCDLRKGSPNTSPNIGVFSYECQGRKKICPGGWYRYNAHNGHFYLEGFAKGPNGNGKEYPVAYDWGPSEDVKEACLSDPTCRGITCSGNVCTLRSGRLEISPGMERSYLCRG